MINHSPFEDVSGIPMFGRNGTALTPEERLDIAKRRGVCVRCGRQTHKVKILGSTPLTNDDVFNGVCIKCKPESVPVPVLSEWQSRNTQSNSALNASVQSRFASRHLDSSERSRGTAGSSERYGGVAAGSSY